MTTIKILYFADSYQYRSSEIHHFDGPSEFDLVKARVKVTLEGDKYPYKTPAETFWAMFEQWDGEKWFETKEMFTHRVKVNKK